MNQNKSEKVIFLRNMNLVEQLDNKSIKQLAEKFKVSEGTIKNVLTEQLKTKRDVIPIQYGSDGTEENLLSINGIGEWKYSQERISIKEYKLNVLLNNFD